MKDELNDELNAARNVFFNAWKKHCDNKPLEPLEKQIVHLIAQHPEYHDFFNNPDAHPITNPSDLFANPFLHISLHLSILEQLTINQPIGIKKIYQQLTEKYNDAHQAEHLMMQCLQEMMSESWANNEDPNPEKFLKLLSKYI